MVDNLLSGNQVLSDSCGSVEYKTSLQKEK